MGVSSARPGRRADAAHAAAAPAPCRRIPLGPGEPALSPEDVRDVAAGAATVVLGDAAAACLARSHATVQRCIDENRLVYGLTTGFGPLAGRTVSPAEAETLQRNLIYHLATGVGECLSWEQARAVLLARLASLVQGHSGADLEMVERMVQWLDTGLAPAIPCKGTVGASGDLTPSAHMALALMGEGEVVDRAGRRTPARAALARAGVSPLALRARRGLALVNGTAAMTGLGALVAADARRYLRLALGSAAVTVDLLRGAEEAHHALLARVRPHPGQRDAQALLAQALAGSARLLAPIAEQDWRDYTDRLPPQDPYSLRCLQQLFGAVYDFAHHAERVVRRELNAVTDNPVFDGEADLVVHGGNFYGQHVAFAMDTFAMVLVKAALLLERQLALLCDEKRNRGFPPFLTPSAAGLHSGLMGAQVTASSLVAEMRTQLGHASVQSIPTNGENQDVNTMGTTAARLAGRVLGDAWRVLAIHAVAVAQGVDLAGGTAARPAFAPASLAWRDWVRETVPALAADRPLGGELEALARRLREDTRPPGAVAPAAASSDDAAPYVAAPCVHAPGSRPGGNHVAR